nr:unnamed protein product [Callosobruchus analis]
MSKASQIEKGANKSDNVSVGDEKKLKRIRNCTSGSKKLKENGIRNARKKKGKIYQRTTQKNGETIRKSWREASQRYRDKQKITNKGTLKIQSTVWLSKNPGTIHFRRLTCVEGCRYDDLCEHYHLGEIQISPARIHDPIKYSDKLRRSSNIDTLNQDKSPPNTDRIAVMNFKQLVAPTD